MADQSEHLKQRLKGQGEFIEILARTLRDVAGRWSR